MKMGKNLDSTIALPKTDIAKLELLKKHPRQPNKEIVAKLIEDEIQRRQIGKESENIKVNSVHVEANPAFFNGRGIGKYEHKHEIEI